MGPVVCQYWPLLFQVVDALQGGEGILGGFFLPSDYHPGEVSHHPGKGMHLDEVIHPDTMSSIQYMVSTLTIQTVVLTDRF